MTRSAAAPSRNQRSNASASSALTRYFEETERPLASLLFLLPLIAIYEIGTSLQPATAHGQPQHIVAFALTQQFFQFFGATVPHLPALAVIGLLLACHIAHKNSWRFDLRHIGWMAIESALLALPLFGIGVAIMFYWPKHLLAATSGITPASVVYPIGAGIYEELVFRLVGVTVLGVVTRDVLKMAPKPAMAMTILGSAVLFSAYHYLGAESFSWSRFTFRTIAGIYLTVVFLFRGFGVTAGSHAAYDILIALA